MLLVLLARAYPQFPMSVGARAYLQLNVNYRMDIYCMQQFYATVLCYLFMLQFYATVLCYSFMIPFHTTVLFGHLAEGHLI